jgi:motility protein A
MFAIIGILVVFGCVVAGYLMENGNIRVQMQPAESQRNSKRLPAVWIDELFSLRALRLRAFCTWDGKALNREVR